MESRPHLLTSTPAEGHALALQFARDLLAAVPAPTTAAAHLRSGATPPSLEITAAIYFHAIAQANRGWSTATAR